MKSIGGYFELEIGNGADSYHEAITLKNGRAALFYILGRTRPSMVHVPYYTCDSLLEPIALAKIPYSFYEIDNKLEPIQQSSPRDGELFIYVNYFGIKGAACQMLAGKYGSKLVIDATQAFFMKSNGKSWLFNSCRKFFGVPDGSYIYPPAGRLFPYREKNRKYLTEHLTRRLAGDVQGGYEFFQENEKMMDCEQVGMSEFSEEILSRVDYSRVERKRLENFNFLHERFAAINELRITPGPGDVPMCYPLLPARPCDKTRLHKKNIFIPTLWQEVLTRYATGFDFEKKLAKQLLPLPVDHRYDIADMEYLAASVTNLLGN